MQHRFVAYVEDKPGVLTRVASLFRRLNLNIVSVTVGRSERPGVSRIDAGLGCASGLRPAHHGFPLQAGKRAGGG